MSICYFWRVCAMAGLVLGALPHPVLSQSSDQRASGIVSARQHVVLASPRGGQLVERHAVASDRVQKGAVLGRFDCSVEDAGLAVAQVELDQANTELNLQNALVARGAAGRAAVQLATLTVALQQARKAQQTAKMASCDIVAPFSGMVVNWKIRNFASVQQGVPVLELVDSTDLFVELIVPVKWIDRLAIGQVTSFTSDHSGRTYTATIDMISAAADPVSQTIRINASLTTSGNPPKVGTSGSMVFGQ